MPRSAVVVVTDVDVILSQLELIADNAQSRKHIDKYSLGFISALKTYFGDNKHRVLVPVKSVGAIPTSMSRSFVDMLDLGDIKAILNDTSDTPTFLTRKGAETYIKEKQRFNSLYAEVDQILDRSISLTHFQNRNKGKWLQLVSKNTLNCRLEEEQLDSCILLTSSMVRDAFQSQTFSRVKVAKSTMSSADKQVASVRWADIGGLERVREEVMNLIQLPIANPNLFPSGCHRRRGILFFGPPGNGNFLYVSLQNVID